MKPNPLDSLDVRSLRALHLLLETRSVTQSARRLGLSQPTMSRLLADLRELFADPLLVPAGRSLAPTAAALALAPRLADALAAVQALLDPPPGHAPQPEWRIGASDYGFTVVCRPWLAALPSPRPRVTVLPLGLDSIGAAARGDLHLAIAARVRVRGAEGLVFRPLLRDEHVVVLRKGHPSSRAPLTLERYLTLEHVMVQTETPGRSLVERALGPARRERRVALRVATLTHALAAIVDSDLVATLPARFVRAQPGLTIERPAPFAVPPLEVHLAFSPRYTSDPAHVALRQQLLRLVGVASRLTSTIEG